MPKKDLSNEPPKVLLTSILVHQIFIDFEKHLIDDGYLLKVAKHITPEAVQMLLMLHPVITVENKKQITCIAGIRTLNLASQTLPTATLIPVIILKKLTEEQISNYCFADLLLTPLTLSLDSGGHVYIDSLRAKIGNRCDAWTDLAKCSKVKLARAFGLSRGCLYSHDRNK